ncbi:autoinducer binding domain-containing protein [Erwinia tracheiphila]|uniref:autoinducer binding domain-containing protein n=1 Tax=Erwinia tracheiphila TaxID=65700 RepID=UPI001F338862|nr:autoinducer binding domain-containing protein [Erwinia tracheiphila]UIA85166.1 autoinducer binding domain-containing protein [Erwinia tracheiphila]UIA93766.1 autoinducer binding domain-containing protein [Erwinia tracheiphila]
MGLDFYALYIRHLLPFTQPRIFLYSNYPDRWVKIWQKRNFAELDPVIKHCMVPDTLLTWNDVVISKGLQVCEAAKEYGICSGFSCSKMIKSRSICILPMASVKFFENIVLTQDGQLKYTIYSGYGCGCLTTN